ncbi:hypothetical protein JM18_000249 [Phytophthora kernoviae]|uniref:Cyclic nucleotide-binding domain-containing protein n=1 Tax=Phytophthora kernoviae TaxID=325452 RepID=A0A8T0M9U2_9STRA|nr:hypothetical protein JM16_000333 [Phytophthora kernoviae]KAG2533512.1 hypothetical protein JM18_000249 [Phytophthora kernoviae]
MRFLKASKGIELEDGDALFHFGDRADAFYCIMYGTMTVVMDFAHMAAPTLNEFEEIIKRARVHSSFMNPGGKLDMSTDATYVVRTMKPLEVFGDVGLLHEEQQRTASVMATENTLLMQIDRDTFMALRACNLSRELRTEKNTFLRWVRGQTLVDIDRHVNLPYGYPDCNPRQILLGQREGCQAFHLASFSEYRSRGAANHDHLHVVPMAKMLVGLTCWARQRAGSNDNSSPDGRGDTDNRRDQALVSNVQWGKTSQIMGGLRNGEDKVSVAIVDLFTNKSVDS